MSSERQRNAAFKVFAQNLSWCQPGVADTFLCPFCRTAFGRDALVHPPKLALAHCIPQSLGGRLKALACTECDTRAGRKVDRHLKDRFELEDFYRGIGAKSKRVWLNVDGYRARADIIFGETPSIRVLAHPPAGARAVQQVFREHVENGRPFRLERMPFPNFQRSTIALLRCAFLMMFRYFGYNYILHPNIERVRQQLLHPDKTLIPGRPILRLDDDQLPLDTVGILTEPSELRCFFVPMRFRTEAGTIIGQAIPMPGLDEDGSEIYEKVRAHQEQNRRLDGRCQILTLRPGLLSSPDSRSVAADVWSDVTHTA